MIRSQRATTGQEDVIVLRNVTVQEISEGFEVPAKGSPLQNMSADLKVLKTSHQTREQSVFGVGCWERGVSLSGGWGPLLE